MFHMTEMVPPDSALLITGSLNAMEEDREHGARSAIHPMQIVVEGAVTKCPYFSSWGELGISSLVLLESDRLVMYITTGADLVEITVKDRKVTRIEALDVPDLKDVHEISIIGNMLWLANTGYDEAIAYDFHSREVVRRVKMKQFGLMTSASRWFPSTAEDNLQIDRYHCNQVFKGLDGKLYALVHHADGKQLLARVAKKLTKTHGNGGVIDIDAGRKIHLGLKGPHSVRCVGDEYWVCDSGARTVNTYTANWELKKKLPTVGWGRGADLWPQGGLYYVGISAQRKRYRDRPDYCDKNVVQVFRVADGSLIGEILIQDGIEQINNVYLVSRRTAETLLGLR
jgi:hypothetical protein